MRCYNLRFCSANHLRKLLHARLTHTFHAFERLQKSVARSRTDALDIVQFAVQGVLRSLVAVELYGIAVHLVLYLRQNMEQFGVGLQRDSLRRIAVEQFVGAVAIVLCKSGNGYVQSQFALHNLSHDAHLSQSTVGDN